jgi:CheY-like chemotaxis protein
MPQPVRPTAAVRSVLLVDDNFDVREAIRLNLESVGYEVVCADDGFEAERILDRQRLDALVTDILMPERDGLELIRLVLRKNPEMRIIAMSGGSSQVSADLCLQVARGFHVDGLLHKPFSINDLLPLLRMPEPPVAVPVA